MKIIASFTALVAATAAIATLALTTMAQADLKPGQDAATFLRCNGATAHIKDENSYDKALTLCKTSIVYYAAAESQAVEEDDKCRALMYEGATFLSTAYIFRYSTKKDPYFQAKGTEFMSYVIDNCNNEPEMQKTAASVLKLELSDLDG